MGGLILALSDDPQSTKAWAVGARGEEILGTRLDKLKERGTVTLHDRKIPRSRANIDHIAATPSGVWIIDAKRYKGRPTLRVEGGILRPRTEKLMVGGRDRSVLLDGVDKQCATVRKVLADAGSGVAVRGCLCFVEADWPLSGGSFRIRDILVASPAKMEEQLLAPGPLALVDRFAIAEILGRVLRPA